LPDWIQLTGPNGITVGRTLALSGAELINSDFDRLIRMFQNASVSLNIQDASAGNHDFGLRAAILVGNDLIHTAGHIQCNPDGNPLTGRSLDILLQLPENRIGDCLGLGRNGIRLLTAILFNVEQTKTIIATISCPIALLGFWWVDIDFNPPV
jgi:hypothetical protein